MSNIGDDGQLRGWPIYKGDDGEFYFSDNNEPTATTWFNRPCGFCGLWGNSNDGDADPCLGNLAGVSNACCGHGNPGEAYIAFIGGLIIRGFEIDEFHSRKIDEEEQQLIFEHNKSRRKFRK